MNEIINDFVISTTSSLDGYSVKTYFGAISAHTVAGVNIFSDYSAALSDVIGGNSLASENKLMKMEKEVTNKLKVKAEALGANAIIGLSIDFDEISGGGKSMFMVTATGTAVVIRNSETSKYELIKKYTNSKSELEKLKIELELKKLGFDLDELLEENESFKEIKEKIELLEAKRIEAKRVELEAKKEERKKELLETANVEASVLENLSDLASIESLYLKHDDLKEKQIILAKALENNAIKEEVENTFKFFSDNNLIKKWEKRSSMTLDLEIFRRGIDVKN